MKPIPHKPKSVGLPPAILPTGALTVAPPSGWQHRENRMSAIANAALDAILMMDPAGKISYWNPAAERLFGYTSDEAISQELHALIMPPQYHPAHLAAIPAFFKTGTGASVGKTCDLEALRKDGSKIAVQLSLSATQIDGQWHAIGVLRDVTERQQAQFAFKGVSDLLQKTAAIAMIGGWELNLADGSVEWTEETFRIHEVEAGYQPCLSADLTFYPPESRPLIEAAVNRAIQHGESYELEIPFVTAKGNRRWVVASGTAVNEGGKCVRLMGTFQDITERHRLKRLAMSTHRLEALGTLAGGVAHDLNNTLAPILMGAEMIRTRYPEETKLLDMIESSAKRAAGMAKQLVTFAKGADGDRAIIHPDYLIKELDNLMQNTFPKNIQLMVNYDQKLSPVLGDATQLHQVLLNLCVNARDAMPHGGTLTLEAKRREVDAAHARSIPGAKPGLYLALRVSDTGAGIAPEIIERIFDPFFTTKDPDKGTGLGLTTVLGIVKGSGGFLQVDSKPGHGSTFTVYLPAALPESDAAISIKVASEFRGHGETILFLDDEPQIRAIARMVLRHLNFVPLTAANGADALVQALEHRTELRAIITDQQMPQMDGVAFVRGLRGILPHIPVVVASAQVEETVAAEFKAMGVTCWLDKPFSASLLAEALRLVLQK